MRYTERHCGKAVIKDKALLPKALEKLTRIEEAELVGCKKCMYEECTKQLYPCRICRRDKKDLYQEKGDEHGHDE